MTKDRISWHASLFAKGKQNLKTDCISQGKQTKAQAEKACLLHLPHSLTAATNPSIMSPHILSTHCVHRSSTN